MSEFKENMHAGANASKFEFAKQLRKTETTEEKKVWEYLRTKPQGLKWRRQHPFSYYVLDFYCHKLKLSIEIDGKIHNDQKEYDQDRTDVINDYGIMELRFTNDDINTDFGGFKIRLEKIISQIN